MSLPLYLDIETVVDTFIEEIHNYFKIYFN